MSRRPIGTPDSMQLFVCPAKHCTLQVLTPGGVPRSHKCPYEGGETRISWMAYGPTLLQQYWDELDRVVTLLMQNKPEPSYSDEWTKGYARGLAFTLSLLMVPHFRTQDEIIREAIKRKQMLDAGEEYDTPGLGSRRFEPPPGDNKLATSPPKAAPPVKPTPRITLTEEDQEEVRNSPMPAQLLASAYECSIAEIEYIQSKV